MPETVIDTPFGPIGLQWDGRTLTGVDLDPPIQDPGAGVESVPQPIGNQLRTYFEQPSIRFDLSVKCAGTAFQERVWDALRARPAPTGRSPGCSAAARGQSGKPAERIRVPSSCLAIAWLQPRVSAVSPGTRAGASWP